MKTFEKCRDDIHKCSKCGLCQAVCPIYSITKNDCTVSRGHFIMLKGVLDGKLQLSKNIKKYLDMCLMCGKCSEFCPSGIEVIDIIAAAKYEFFKKSIFEKLESYIQKYLIFKFVLPVISFFNKPPQSRSFKNKVIYFSGCNGKISNSSDIVKVLNNVETEVVMPSFDCCGITFLTRGDLCNFNDSIKSYIRILKMYDIKEIITTCASCEKMLKSYIRWCDDDEDLAFLSELKVKNIYQYLKEKNCKFKLKNSVKVTYHRPCNQSNYDDIEWLLNSTENLEYIKSDNYDKCCGLSSMFNFRNRDIYSKISKLKQKDILNTKAKCVLTTCSGCKIALSLISENKYKVKDLIKFISKNI